MKKRFPIYMTTIICVLLCGIMILSGCEKIKGFFKQMDELTYRDGDLQYWRHFSKDGEDYYSSGTLVGDDKQLNDSLFIPRTVNGLPVLRLGFLNLAPISVPIYDGGSRYKPENVYCSGRIQKCEYLYFRTYEADSSNAVLRIFYCGEVIDLSYAGYGESVIYYVPSAQFDEYKALWDEQYVGEIRSANIEYHLNAEEMEEFYYIDYVESGKQIENVPPEPTREGYRFEGWYLDKDGEQAWNFDKQIESGESENIVLYAQWQKI